MVESKSGDNEKHGLTPMQGAGFLLGVTGAAALGGFAMMFARSRKNHPEDFYHGVASDGNGESGARLAMRALGRATVYSVGGFSIFCFAVWKLMGVKNMQEFSAKMQSFMPRVSPENAKKETIDWDEIFKGKSKTNDSKKNME